VTTSQAAELDPLARRLGIRITGHTPQRVAATMPVDGNRQPYGLLHGGANAVLAETLAVLAANANAPAGRTATGLEVSCSHHRSATEGSVTGVCTPLRTGRTAASFEIVITDEAGTRTCTARVTCLLHEH
jgi:uncharacterized protein (TIGR00369 family)